MRLALAAVVLALASSGDFIRPATAAAPNPAKTGSWEGTTSDAARQDAAASIPMDRLAPEDRAKVNSVLSNASVFRRMPVRAVDCDPDMYLFLLRHPDVVVNTWEVLKLSKLQLIQTGENRFQLTELPGTVANLRLVYQSRDTHVVYGEGNYEGPLLARSIKGRGVLVLKTGYARDQWPLLRNEPVGLLPDD